MPLVPLKTLAAPQSFEIWFLAPPTFGLQIPLVYSPILLAQVSNQNEWVRMGEGWFHPQEGMITNEQYYGLPAKKRPDQKVLNPTLGQNYLSNYEPDKFTCDESNAFDFFCGKAKSAKNSAPESKNQVWVDISSSMKTVDYPRGSSCYRKSFLTKLKESCSDFSSFLFTTSLKSMGSVNDACDTRGLNDLERLKKWIQRSDAKHLVIITDIAELSTDLVDFAFLHNGKLLGKEGDFFARHLDQDFRQRAAGLLKRCSKQ